MPLPPGVLDSKHPKEMVRDWLSANRKYFIASKKIALNRKSLEGSEVSTSQPTFSEHEQKVSEEKRQRGGADEEFYNKFPRKTEDSKLLLSEKRSIIEKQRGICKFCKGPLDNNPSTDCDANKIKCSPLNERLPGQCYICYEPSYRELPVEFIENANMLSFSYGANNTSCYEINSLSYSNPLINAPYSTLQGSDIFLDSEFNGDCVSPLYGSLHTIQETPLEVYPMHVDVSNALSRSLSRIVETLGNGEQDYFIVDSSRSRRKLFKKNEEIKISDLDLNVNANGELRDNNYYEGRHSEIICIKKYEIEKTADDSNINEAVSTNFKMNDLNIMRKNEISSKTSEKEIVSIIRIGPQSYLLLDNYFSNSIHNLETKILVPINTRDGSNIQHVIERCGLNFNKKQPSVSFDLKNDMILEEKEETEISNGASQDVEGIHQFNNYVMPDTSLDNTESKSHKSEQAARISCQAKQAKEVVVESCNDGINYNTTCKMDVKRNENGNWQIKYVPKFTSELNVKSLNKCIVIGKVVKQNKVEDIEKPSLHKANLEKNKEYPIMLDVLKTNGGKANKIIKNNGKKNDLSNIGDARKKNISKMNIQCESSEDALFDFEETTIQVLPLDSEEKSSEASKQNDVNVSSNSPLKSIETDIALKKNITITNPTNFNKIRNLDLSDSYHKYDNANDKWSYVVHYKKNSNILSENTLATDKSIPNSTSSKYNEEMNEIITEPVNKNDTSPDYRTSISLDVADHSTSSRKTKQNPTEKCFHNLKDRSVQIEEKCSLEKLCCRDKSAILNLEQTLEQKMKEPVEVGSILFQNNLDNQHSPILKLKGNTEKVDMSFKKSTRDEYNPSNSRCIEENNQLSDYSVNSNKQPFINMDEMSTKIQKFYKINSHPTNELNNEINLAIYSEYSKCPNGTLEEDYLEKKPERKLAYTRIMDSQNVLLDDETKVNANCNVSVNDGQTNSSLNSIYSTNKHNKELPNVNVTKHNKNTNHTQNNSNHSTLTQFSNVIHYQGNLLRQARYTKEDDLSEEDEIKLIGESLSPELINSSKRQLNVNKHPQETVMNMENNLEAEMKQQCEEAQFTTPSVVNTASGINQHRKIFLPKNTSVDSCTSPLHSEYSKICDGQARDTFSRLRGGCDKPVIISSLDIGNIALFSNNETTPLLCTDSTDVPKKNGVRNALIYNGGGLGMTIQHHYPRGENLRSNTVEGHDKNGINGNATARKKRSPRNIVVQTHIDCEDTSKESLQPTCSIRQANKITMHCKNITDVVPRSNRYIENVIVQSSTYSENALHIKLPYRHFCGQTKMKTIVENNDALDNENINNMCIRRKRYLRNEVTQSCADSKVGLNKAFRPRCSHGQTDLRGKTDHNNFLDDKNLDNISKITSKRKRNSENNEPLGMDHKNMKSISENNNILSNAKSINLVNITDLRKRTTLSMALKYACSSTEENKKTVAENNIVLDKEHSNNHRNITPRKQRNNETTVVKSNIDDECNLSMMALPSVQTNKKYIVENNMVLSNVSSNKIKKATGLRKRTSLTMALQYASSNETNKKTIAQTNLVVDNESSNNTNRRNELSNRNALVKSNIEDASNVSMALLSSHAVKNNNVLDNTIANNIENTTELRKRTTLNMELQYTPSSTETIINNKTRQKKQRNEDALIRKNLAVERNLSQTKKTYVVRNNIVLGSENANNINSICQCMKQSNENALVQRNLLRERNLNMALHHASSSGKAIKKCIAQNNIVAGKENSINTNIDNSIRTNVNNEYESCFGQTSTKVLRKGSVANSVIVRKLEVEDELGMELQCAALSSQTSLTTVIEDANILHNVNVNNMHSANEQRKQTNVNAMVGKELDSDPTLRIASPDASCFDQSSKETIVDGHSVLDDVKSHTTTGMKRSLENIVFRKTADDSFLSMVLRNVSSSDQLSKITTLERNNKSDDVSSNSNNANLEKPKRSVLAIVLFGNDNNSMKTNTKRILQSYSGQKIKNKRLWRKFDYNIRKSKISNINNIRLNHNRRSSSQTDIIKVYATNCNKNIRRPNSAVLEKVRPKVMVKERVCHKHVQCYPFLVVPFIEEESQTEQTNSKWFNSDTNLNEVVKKANISSSMVCVLNSDDLIQLNNIDVNLQEDADHSPCCSYSLPISKKASDEYDSYCTICEQLKVATHVYYKNLTSIIPKTFTSKLNSSISVENKKNKLIYMCNECNTALDQTIEIQQKKQSLCKQKRAEKESEITDREANTVLMCLKCNILLTPSNYENNNLLCNDCQPLKCGNKLNKLTACAKHVNMHLSSSKDEAEVPTSNALSKQTDSNNKSLCRSNDNNKSLCHSNDNNKSLCRRNVNKKSLCRKNDKNNDSSGKLSNDDTSKPKPCCHLQCKTKKQKENDAEKNLAKNANTICVCALSKSSMSLCSKRSNLESEEKVIQCCTYNSSECCNVRTKPRKEHSAFIHESGLVRIKSSSSKRKRNNRHSREKKDIGVLKENLFSPKRTLTLTSSERRKEFFTQCMSFYESRRYVHTGKNHDFKNTKNLKKPALQNGVPWIANPDEYGDMWMPHSKKVKRSGLRTRTDLKC